MNWVAGMSWGVGPCDNCSNQTPWRYVRTRNSRRMVLCNHCVDLMELGRVRMDGNPRNQPSPVQMHGKLKPCVYCTKPSAPKYYWRGELLSFCGWGCAGFWMDNEVEKTAIELELPDGEAYVRQSLGLE